MNATSGVLDVRPTTEKMRTGIEPADREAIADELSGILTDTYLLVVKTHIYHWNVVGPLFHPIHEMTEAQYNDLFAACDVIAERIRALGFTAPRKTDRILEGGAIDIPAALPSAGKMIADLVGDHETLVRALRSAASLSEEKGDFVTHDMLTARLTVHEKAIWMLRAIDAD